MSELNLCYGCMKPLDGATVCPNCGYDNHTSSLDAYLKPGLVLHERYLIGKAMESNGEGVTYIAYDCNIGCRVLVREYFPEQLCKRVPNSPLIDVDSAHLAQYKALMAEYTELNKALARLRSLDHLNPALDLFAENNTTYAVFEYLNGCTLLEYLRDNAGELSWTTVRRIFPPLFTTLSLLHNAGVLHRGISPETIYVTDKRTLKLCGFCISAVRTNHTELEAELYDGYAAPEQYFADRQQGTWTDVYGICAVLYRILTGCRATDAHTRLDYDNLTPPMGVNDRIPENVSSAIMRGLSLDSTQRIKTITDLVTLLFDNTEKDDDTAKTATAIYRADSIQQAAEAEKRKDRTIVMQSAKPVSHAAEHSHEAVHKTEHVQAPTPKPESKQESWFERMKRPLVIAVLLCLILVICIVGLMKLLGGNESSSLTDGSSWSSIGENVVQVSSAETTTAPKYDGVMPRLVGMNYQIKKGEMAGWLELEPEFVFSEEYPENEIIWQEIEEGELFMSGSTIKVQVSLGSSRKELPAFSGFQLQAYLAKLEEMGFVKATDGNRKPVQGSSSVDGTTTTENPLDQKIIFKTKVDYNYANGYVCAVSPQVGTVIDLQKDYEIIVYYANNPEITTTTTESGAGETTTSGSQTEDTSNSVSTTTTTTTTVEAAAE